METYPGKDVVVEVDVEGGAPADLPGVLSVSVSESADAIRSDAAGDDWKKFKAGKKEWSGSIALRKDSLEAKQGVLRAGVSIDLNIYLEGNTTGLEKMSGTALTTGRTSETEHDGIAGISFEIQGNGALAIDTVAA